METKIQRWGNSLAVRIPGPFAREIHLGEGSRASIVLRNGSLVVRPSKASSVKLERLLAKVKPDQLYGEIGTGRAVGREAW